VFLRIGRPARSALRPAGLAGLCAKTFSSAARGSSEQEKGPVHYEILKNYYDADQLRRILSPHARDLIIHVGKRFWWVNYRTAQIRRIRPGSLI
jgi:hypothetical protein